MLTRFREHRLKLKPSKCQFFRTHTVEGWSLAESEQSERHSRDGTLTTFMGIREFTGATGFYRRFIKNYSKISKLLNDLLTGKNSQYKNRPVQLLPKRYLHSKNSSRYCLSAPVLRFADFNRPFVLETDASKEGLGAVLSQLQEDGKLHPVAYGSRGLKGGEKQYHSSSF